MLNLLSSFCKVFEQTLASIRNNVLDNSFDCESMISASASQDLSKLDDLGNELRILLNLAKEINKNEDDLKNANLTVSSSSSSSSSSSLEVINLNIGGKLFSTYRCNLTKKVSKLSNEDSYCKSNNQNMTLFEEILNDESKVYFDRNNCIFFDRDPTYFNYILDYLRKCGTNEKFILPENSNEINKLFIEAKYFKLAGFNYYVYKAFLKSQIFMEPILYKILFEEIKIALCKWTLIYRGSQHGFTAKSFHKKCDTKQNVIVLIQTKYTNSIFGGYSSVGWTSSGGYRRDERSFLFTLKKNADLRVNKLECSKIDYAINSSYSYGPSFGNGDLTIYGGFCKFKYFNKIIGTSKLGNSYELDDKTQNNSFLAGSRLFEINEIEVFTLCEE